MAMRLSLFKISRRSKASKALVKLIIKPLLNYLEAHGMMHHVVQKLDFIFCTDSRDVFFARLKEPVEFIAKTVIQGDRVMQGRKRNLKPRQALCIAVDTVLKTACIEVIQQNDKSKVYFMDLDQYRRDIERKLERCDLR